MISGNEWIYLPRPFGQYSSLLHNLPPNNKQWEFPPPHVFAKDALCTILQPFTRFETNDVAMAIFKLMLIITENIKIDDQNLNEEK